MVRMTKLFINLREYIITQDGISAADEVIEFGEVKEMVAPVLLDFSEYFGAIIPEFAATKMFGGSSQKKKCVKGFACGNGCLPIKTKSGKDTQCRNQIEGQAKTYTEFLTQSSSNPQKNDNQSNTSSQKQEESAKVQSLVETSAEISQPIKIGIPPGRKIHGDKTTTKQELRAIGIKAEGDNIELTDDQLDNLHLIRNGKKNLQEFLDSPPKKYKDEEDDPVVIYSGERVSMTVAPNGDVRFTVDDSYDAGPDDVDKSIPSQELREMTRAWLRYSKSNASDRVLWNNPYEDVEGRDRSETRARIYEKYGFSSAKDDVTGKNTMVLDNRKNKTKKLDPLVDHFVGKTIRGERDIDPDELRVKNKIENEGVDSILIMADLKTGAKYLSDDDLLKKYNEFRTKVGLPGANDAKQIREKWQS